MVFLVNRIVLIRLVSIILMMIVFRVVVIILIVIVEVVFVIVVVIVLLIQVVVIRVVVVIIMVRVRMVLHLMVLAELLRAADFIDYIINPVASMPISMANIITNDIKSAIESSKVSIKNILFACHSTRDWVPF